MVIITLLLLRNETKTIQNQIRFKWRQEIEVSSVNSKIAKHFT